MRQGYRVAKTVNGYRELTAGGQQGERPVEQERWHEMARDYSGRQR